MVISTPPTGVSPATTTGRASERGASSDTRAVAPEAEAKAGGGNVAVSDTARRMAELEGSIPRTPAFNAETVASLRAAVEDGSYRVDSDRVAAAILQLESGL